MRIIADRLSKNVPLEPPPLNAKVMEAAERLLGMLVPAAEAKGHRSERASTAAPSGSDGYDRQGG